VQIEKALSTAMAYGAREDAGGRRKEGSKDSVCMPVCKPRRFDMSCHGMRLLTCVCVKSLMRGEVICMYFVVFPSKRCK
jgi:hypothetical protein